MSNVKNKNEKQNHASRLAKKGLNWLVKFIFWSTVGWVSMAFISLGMYVGNPLVTVFGIMLFAGSLAIYILRRKIASKITKAIKRNNNK